MLSRHVKSATPSHVTLAYALIASTWILLSDVIVQFLQLDGTLLFTISVLKGLAFVGVTTIALYLLLHRTSRIERQLQSELREQDQGIITHDKALEQSENWLMKAIEEAPIPMMIFAEDGEVLVLSNIWMEITGYTAQELRSIESWTGLAYGEAQEPVKEGIDKLFDLDRRVDEGEFTVTCRNGQKRIWSFSSAPVGRGSDGRRRVMSVAYDVTERKQIELDLREAKARFEQIAEHIREIFYLYDADTGEALYISSAYEQAWGQSRDSLYQNPRAFIDLVHPDDRKRVIANFALQLQGKQVESRYRIIRPDRDVRWIRSQAFPVYSQDGQLTRVAGIVEDITELVKSQQKLKRLSRKLVNILDEERARIARELHDQIGQELTALGINLGIIETKCGVNSGILNIINDSSEQVSNMLGRIRRIISDLKPLALDDMGLAAGLRWYCERFSRRTGIVVNLDELPTDLSISEYVDNTLYQIMQEALTNVARHSQATTVWIDVREAANQITLTIRDNGIGFDVKATLDDKYGRSWGLLIIQERIQSVMGSRLYIHSDLGHGTEISIEVQL